MPAFGSGRYFLPALSLWLLALVTVALVGSLPTHAFAADPASQHASQNTPAQTAPAQNTPAQTASIQAAHIQAPASSATVASPAVSSESKAATVPSSVMFLDESPSADATAQDRQVLQKIAQKYPNLQVMSIGRLPVGSTFLFEFIAGGSQKGREVVCYTDLDVGFVLIGGELVTGTGKDMINVTKERAVAAARRVLTNLPTAGALKLVYGKGERTLKIFSDPDCPFCRRLERDMASNPDKVNATVYIYPFPLTGLHPKADERARYLLCTQNPSQTWHDWAMTDPGDDAAWSAFAAAHPAQPDCPASREVDLSVRIGRAIGLMQTPMLVFANGSVLDEAPTDVDQLDKMLSVGQKPTANP